MKEQWRSITTSYLKIQPVGVDFLSLNAALVRTNSETLKKLLYPFLPSFFQLENWFYSNTWLLEVPWEYINICEELKKALPPCAISDY